MDAGARARRPVYGPDAGTERHQTYRPVRDRADRWRDIRDGKPAAALLAAGAGACLAAPALWTAVVPAALAYAGSVLARPVTLPLRLPITAKRRDHNDPAPGGRRPRMAAGIVYLGRDARTGEEVWISNADARQHMSFSGITGSGKTAALLGLCANALSMGSGFVFIDGKADVDLAANVYALCRRFGRDKDMRHLNFLVASGGKDSNSFNPFAWVNADAIREMLLSQIEQNPLGGAGGDGNKIFAQRAAQLLGALTPIFVWLRDHKRVPIDIDAINHATELECIASLVFSRKHRRRDPKAGTVTEIDVSDMPEGLVFPLRAYLGQTGGFDPSLPWNKQKSTQPAEQHSFAQMHFGATFTQLGVSLGHIFARGWSDIDMRDVLLNRRVLVVSLPALENSGETTAALGKLVIATLRGMMAQTLGGELEGDYQEIVANRPTSARTPFLIAADELAAYIGGGMDKLLQQARGLGNAFALGWHDVEGLEARVGQQAMTVLNNTGTSVWMRQNLGGRSRQIMERSVGEGAVTETARYTTHGAGDAREAREVQVRHVARVDWRDLRELVEGEAVVVQGNKRVAVDMFHAETDPNGAMRMNRPVPVPPADPKRAADAAAEVAAVRDALLAGDPSQPAGDPPAVVRALVDGWYTARDAGLPAPDAAEAAVLKVGTVADEPAKALPPPDPAEPPRTEFTPALEAGPVPVVDPDRTTAANVDRQAVDILQALAAIEEMLGAPGDVALREAHRALAGRDAALEAIAFPDPPPAMALPDLRALLDDLAKEMER